MSTNVSGAGFPVTATLVAQTRLIASGATPSFHFLLVSHVTVDANGGLAVQFEHEQEVCRGAKWARQIVKGARVDPPGGCAFSLAAVAASP